MSISVGTAGERRVRRSVWPAAFLAAVIMVTAALVAFTLSREGPRTPPASGAPTEVSSEVDGTVSGTAANTPSEIRGRFASTVDPARIGPQIVGGGPDGWVVQGNTPTELSGGLPAEFRARHQLR